MPKLSHFLNANFNGRWLKIISPLIAAIVLLVALDVFSMQVLSSVGAYIGALGQYTKAQKDAVLSLNDYSRSHDETDYQQFLRAMTVPLGMRQGRIDLDQRTPDIDAARRAFLAARNHPDNVDRLVWLFIHFRDVSFMRDIIVLWDAANRQIEELGNEGALLHAAIETSRLDEAVGKRRAEHLKRINLRLSALEEHAAALLGNASRTLRDLLLGFTVAIGALLICFGSAVARAILKKKEQFQQALRASEERLHLAMRSNSDGVWDWDIVAGSIYYSPRLKELLEESSSASTFRRLHFLRHVHAQDLSAMKAKLARYLRDHTSFESEFRIITQTGQQRWLRARGQSVRDAAGKPVRMAGSVTDITERKQAALELTRSNRALQMLSRCNEVLIRAADEASLLVQVCRLAVDIGGYRMAWVGYAQRDAARAISAAAQAGDGGDMALLRTIALNWQKDAAAGQGAAGRTIRSGAAVRFDDLTQLSAAAPGAGAAPRASSAGICLPLRDKDFTFGLLVLCSNDALRVSAQESRLLQELADDLAFGIASLRARQAQQRIQDAVLKIAAGVSASTGSAFFEHLALHMTEALGACAGFVGRLSPTVAGSVSTLAAVVHGSVTDNFDYVMAGTPCEALLTADHFIVFEQMAACYPLPPAVMALAPQAYVGWRLDNFAGQPIGVLFVLFDAPLHNPVFATSTLKIFAARAAAEMARQETDARIQDQAALLDKAQDAIIVRGMDQRIEFWNKSAERLYGWTRHEAIGQPIQKLFFDTPGAFLEASDTLLAEGEWSGELSKQHKDGSSLLVESRCTLVRNGAGLAQAILSIETDITQRKAAERAAMQLAFYDPLTQLPNRRLLLDRLQQVLRGGVPGRTGGALLFIDMDNFKTINDTRGHERGDLLLCQVAQRLAASVRASDTVARLGGDEFVVMLPDLDGASHTEATAQAGAVAQKILAALSTPYLIAGSAHHSTASIGVTLFRQDDSVGELLRRADLAMYQAKAAGRNTLRFFDPQMQAAISARAALEADLRLALTRDDEFVLHYQTQVDGAARMTGVEALLRWRHPRLGMVAPNAFIALAEETGLILPLGLWVLQTACAQLAAWARRAETAQLTMAVNVSVRQFAQPDFVAEVGAVLARSGANPRLLKLEITESLMVNDIAETIAKMAALKAAGIRFALDDFGTGYSSLTYLKRLPLDQVKIDKSFVQDLLTDPNDAAIARTIVALAQSLGLDVIAEGVESEEQRALLAQLGCHDCQGYLFSRPLPIVQLEDVMRLARHAAPPIAAL